MGRPGRGRRGRTRIDRPSHPRRHLPGGRDRDGAAGERVPVARPQGRSAAGTARPDPGLRATGAGGDARRPPAGCGRHHDDRSRV